MSEARTLPGWADDLRRRYLRGEASMFVLCGNVYDSTIYQNRMMALSDFLSDVLLKESKETVVVYNVATGVRFQKCGREAPGYEDLLSATGKDRILAGIERLLVGAMKVAVILEYAEAIAPSGEHSFQTDADRAAIIMLHRWSSVPAIERGDNIIMLITENLSELAPKIVSNPKVAVVEIPIPDSAARKAAALLADPRLTDRDGDHYAEVTAGLKAVQIASILTPPPPAGEDAAEREAFIAELLGAVPGAAERAHKFAALTANMSRDEIKNLLVPAVTHSPTPEPAPVYDTMTALDRARNETYRLIAARKRDILERECFGLIEFVDPHHGFDVVGGLDEVKRELVAIASNIREGRLSRAPMGVLFTGPMGTGKTFVAEAFAKECGLTTIKLKNFRSKWVGATEGNLEKILNVIRAIGQVVVIVDEGDRAFGNTDGEGDGGTSSRVLARIKEFMSDTSNRGRILFLVMTNRPDKLDVDLKRAGRLDRKIPFLHAQTPEEVEQIAAAVIRKNHVKTRVELPSIRDSFSAKLIGYSNADIEAVVLMANDDACRTSGDDAEVLSEQLLSAASDYFPSRDIELLEYMELLAIFEASSRRLLPAKYASTTPAELDARLRQLRGIIGNRR
jgi:transitional endoplasmic reticulum ATPase